jgi:hypothetical protein
MVEAQHPTEPLGALDYADPRSRATIWPISRFSPAPFRAVCDSLAEDHEILDIAAAAMKAS